MTDITWSNSTRKLSELIPWEQNPKKLTPETAEHMKVSLSKFGLAIPLLISPDNDIYDGHQRQSVMAAMAQYGSDAVVDVRVSSRKLTNKERKELVIRLRENQADWDFDLLETIYEVDELKEWGFDDQKIVAYQEDTKEENDDDSNGESGDNSPSDGSLLALIDVSIGEPYHVVEDGDVWHLGKNHILVCCDVLTQWSKYIGFLGDESVLAPYPGPFVALSVKAQKFKMVLVQPSVYIAGHIIDRYAEINGEDSVKKHQEGA